jgi:hypothetical protein
MKPLPPAKFSLPKWSLYVLLGFFIFLSDAPSASTWQKLPVQTGQRDEPRSVKTLPYFVKFHPPVLQNCFLSETRFFQSLLHYSNAIHACFKSRSDLVLCFKPVGIILLFNFLPRSEEESILFKQG